MASTCRASLTVDVLTYEGSFAAHGYQRYEFKVHVPRQLLQIQKCRSGSHVELRARGALSGSLALASSMPGD